MVTLTSRREENGMRHLSLPILAGCLLLVTQPLCPAEEPKARVTFGGYRMCVFSLAYSTDGKWLAAGALEDKVKIWDVAAGKERSGSS